MPRDSPSIRIHINLDADLDAKLRVLLADPVTKRAKYGSISALVNSLLLQWAVKEFEARSKKGKTPNEPA